MGPVQPLILSSAVRAGSARRCHATDIDGTITRSDVLGHAAAWMGTDWTQSDIAGFFSHVHSNGYYFLYLSSRSISQSIATRGETTSVDIFCSWFPRCLNGVVSLAYLFS